MKKLLKKMDWLDHNDKINKGEVFLDTVIIITVVFTTKLIWEIL